MSSFFASGLLLGPMTSGMLLPLVGYWITWFAAIALLVVDMIMRFIMIENKEGQNLKEDMSRDVEATQTHDSTEDNEQTALLWDEPRSDRTHADISSAVKASLSPDTISSPENFFKFILTNCRALTGVACHCTMAIVLLSLDTTLPLHVSRTFGWDSARVSMMFLLLQLPSLLLGTLVGIIKDKVGTRLPTGVGLLAMGFFLWLLGAAADDGLPFLSRNGTSQTTTMISLVGLGTARTLVIGSGILEITSKSTMFPSLCESPRPRWTRTFLKLMCENYFEQQM